MHVLFKIILLYCTCYHDVTSSPGISSFDIEERYTGKRASPLIILYNGRQIVSAETPKPFETETDEPVLFVLVSLVFSYVKY